jgi:predicted NUDIX family NTP pyrophosphohydrolase
MGSARSRTSAGILLYRFSNNKLQVLLVHPGGPFWKNKDAGAWSIPKGEFDENEPALDAAKREMSEETGILITGKPIELTPVRQSNKTVYAWAVLQDADPEKIVSNTFEMEWPPRSGLYKIFPEIDRASWFTTEEARNKIVVAQAALLAELASLVNA